MPVLSKYWEKTNCVQASFENLKRFHVAFKVLDEFIKSLVTPLKINESFYLGSHFVWEPGGK